MSKVIINDVYKKFRKNNVLNGLSFEIENEILFIAGCNGAGKTTLLRLILKMDKQDKGTILLTEGNNEIFNRISCVFDSPCLYPDMNCLENIKIFCTGYLDDKTYVNKVIDDLNIRELLRKKSIKVFIRATT